MEIITINLISGDLLKKECVVKSGSLTATFSCAGLSYTETLTISGGNVLFNIPSSITQAFAIGSYPYAITVTDINVNRSTIETGTLNIKPDLTTKTSVTLTYNETVLNSIRARIQDRSTTDQNNHSINGRTIGRMAIAELTRWEQDFSWRVYNERNNGNIPMIRNKIGFNNGHN